MATIPPGMVAKGRHRRCYVADPGGGFAVVTGPAARWILDALRPRLTNLRDLEPGVLDALVGLQVAADNFRASFLAEVTDCPSPPPAAQSTYDTSAAAELLGISPRAVRQAARERRLAGEETAQGWRFSAAAVEQYRPRRRRTA